MKKRLLVSFVIAIFLVIIAIPYATKANDEKNSETISKATVTIDTFNKEKVKVGDKLEIGMTFPYGDKIESVDLNFWEWTPEGIASETTTTITLDGFVPWNGDLMISLPNVPSTMKEGATYKLLEVIVTRENGQEEIYDMLGEGNELETEGKGEIVLEQECATISLKSNEAKAGEKVYLDLNIPNIENVTKAVLWFTQSDYGQIPTSMLIHDVGNNPYIVLDESELWGTTREVSQVAVWRGYEMTVYNIDKGNLKINGNSKLTKKFDPIKINLMLRDGYVTKNEDIVGVIRYSNGEKFNLEDTTGMNIIFSNKKGGKDITVTANFNQDGVITFYPSYEEMDIGETYVIRGIKLYNKYLEKNKFIVYSTDSEERKIETEYDLFITICANYENVEYRTHIQNIGWEDNYNENGLMSGTTGQSLRLEAVEMRLSGDYNGNIQYRTHIQDIGWENDWKSNGEMSGTEGKSLRLEAIEIKLTGEVANYYNVYYRVHAENFGWLGWASNGAPAGTQGYAYRLEAIQVMLVKKGERVPINYEAPFKANVKVQYTSHVQNIGWQNYVENGELSGTEGQSLRLEGLKINIDGSPYSGDIVYSTHIENIGWQGEVRNNQMSGTQGQSLRLEAMTIRLTGELAEHYSIRYRVHIQDIGWQDWKYDGQIAGTTGLSKRLEGLEIELVPCVG